MLQADSPPPEALASYTGFLMAWLSTRSRGEFGRVLADRFDLGAPEFGAMTLIASNPGMSQSALGQLFGRDPSTMVAVIDRLEELGLAQRGIDPDDRRRRTIVLTKRGERVRRDADRIATELTDELLHALDTKERAELNRLLRKVCGLPEATPRKATARRTDTT